ncbi:MAG: hypothetical protein US76_03195 [Parcubacteria group bacterium GW2011_GWA2_38_13b]|nr:MAG: hypothetical protein US76_03195 [Parcubacteria group bacterium GW2011_GWA2_38_13b]
MKKALKEFNNAFQWAIKYPYCSLADYAEKREAPIIEKDILGELFPTPKAYKNFVRDYLLDEDVDFEGKFGFVEV